MKKIKALRKNCPQTVILTVLVIIPICTLYSSDIDKSLSNPIAHFITAIIMAIAFILLSILDRRRKEDYVALITDTINLATAFLLVHLVNKENGIISAYIALIIGLYVSRFTKWLYKIL